jgi:acyl carrier protein
MDDTAAVDLVTTLVCRVRRIHRSQVPPDADLSETLGFDSLDTAELAS